jgi:hypothetical protein
MPSTGDFFSAVVHAKRSPAGTERTPRSAPEELALAERRKPELLFHMNENIAP